VHLARLVGVRQEQRYAGNGKLGEHDVEAIPIADDARYIDQALRTRDLVCHVKDWKVGVLPVVDVLSPGPQYAPRITDEPGTKKTNSAVGLIR